MSTRPLTNRTVGDTPPMDRRAWLRAAAGTLAASQCAWSLASRAAGDESSLARPIRQNLKLGVHTGPYMKLPLAEAAARIRDEGFSCVLTEYAFADVGFNPLVPDWQAADKIVRTFEQHGIEIVAVFGYVNVVDPIPERLERGAARLTCLIENWKRLGCNNISTETGTFNTSSDWSDAPENFTEEGYTKCRVALEQWAERADKAGAVISIEPYWRNIIDSVERAERLFRDVPSPGLRLVMDPCNYPRKEDLPRMKPMIENLFQRLGEKIVVAHAKDVAPAAEGTDLPAAGRGVLDYPHYLRLLAGLDRSMPLILEHLVLEDVNRARDFVLAALDRV
ncbi:MAG: sugar phosphate isomerase/epimerase family protein [Pirellulaceae bacterium]